MERATRWLFSLLFCWLAFSPVQIRAETNSTSENHFPLLPGLETAVEFWKKIFTEYTTSQLVFFDPLEMSKIYEVVEVGDDDRARAFINSERERIAAAHGVDMERVKAQRGVRERTMAGLQRSGRYMTQIKQIFRERELPTELAYLPLVESSFDVNARSYAGALGMWQFMRATGRQFMRVNRYIDERKDPIESTRAAASFLSQSYELLGNWPLAITSYNYGPAGMARAVEQVQSENLPDLIRDFTHPNWGFAPKNFYAEFLAAVEIGTNVHRFFPDLKIDPPVAIREIELQKSTSLGALAKSTGLTQNQLLGWNPALTARTRVVPAGYRVKVPVDSSREPIVQVAQGGPGAKEKPWVVRHRVKPGETLLHIARRYGASVQRILELNGITRPNFLRVGTTLLIPRL